MTTPSASEVPAGAGDSCPNCGIPGILQEEGDYVYWCHCGFPLSDNRVCELIAALRVELAEAIQARHDSNEAHRLAANRLVETQRELAEAKEAILSWDDPHIPAGECNYPHELCICDVGIGENHLTELAERYRKDEA